MRSAAACSFVRTVSRLLRIVGFLSFSSVVWAQVAPQQPAATPPPPNSQTQPAPPVDRSDPSPSPAQQVPSNQAASSDQQPAAEPPTGADQDSGMFVFKKQVEEVVLHATVYDEQRHLVTDLDKAAFSVFENGSAQPITSFRREDVPIAIGIVVDNSGSMRDKRDAVAKAVVNLISSSNPQDQVFVVNFSQNYYLDQDFTSNVNLLQAALHQETTKGSTALYDAVVASSVHLKSNNPMDKQVLLVITDGEDNMSQETLEEASRKLQQANGPTVYAIGLLGSGLQRSGREALQQLAAGTGGVAYFPDSLTQVDSITRSIAHDIRSQYRIAYKPHNQNGKPEYQTLRVEATAAGYGKLTVRTKSGYYGANSASH